MKFGSRLRSSRELLLDVGTVPDHLQRGTQQPHCRFLAGREDVGGHPHDIAHLGHRPVGEGRGRQAGEHIVTRLAATIFHIRREDLVEVLQGRFGQRLLGIAETTAVGAARKPLDELVAILVGHAKQVGDDAQRERARETLDEFTLTGSEKGVEDVVGELPHRVLVLLEALRCDQSHE